MPRDGMAKAASFNTSKPCGGRRHLRHSVGASSVRPRSKRSSVGENFKPYAEKERKKRLDQGRVDRLLRDAAAFQQAGEIRKYIEAIRLTLSREESSSKEEVEQWSLWALHKPIGSTLQLAGSSRRRCRMRSTLASLPTAAHGLFAML